MQSTLKPKSCAPPSADWLCFRVHTKQICGIYCQCHSPMTQAVVLAFSLLFFPSPPLPVSGDTPLPPHLHHTLSALHFLQVYLLFGSIHSQILYRSDIIFLYRTTLSFLPPIKAIWLVSQGHFFAV